MSNNQNPTPAVNKHVNLLVEIAINALSVISKNRCFWISVLITSIFYLPAFKNGSIDAGFLYTGDVLGWYLPAMAKTHSLLHSFNFTAIDYSTFNGSSDFFLSPNFFAYHPIVVLYCLIVSPQYSNLQQLGQFLVLLTAAHSFLALYFSIKLLKRFFAFDFGSAVLAGTAFAFSDHMMKSLGQTPFLLSAAITPWVAYASLIYVDRKSLRNLVIACLPVIFGLMGGYMPLGVACLALSATLVAARVLYISDQYRNIAERISALVAAMTPYIFALIITAPYLYSIYSFHQETLGASYGSLFYSAYQYSQLPQRILSILSTHINIPGGREFELSIYWGFIAIPLAAIFICSIKSDSALTRLEWKFFKVAALIYFSTLLASFGPYSVVSDLVYYLIPHVGRMHVYQRFFIPAELMFGVMLALMLKMVVNQRPLGAIKSALFVMAVLTSIVAFVLSYQPAFSKELGIDNNIVIELLLGTLFVCVLLIPGQVFIYSATIILFCLPLLNKVYDYSAPGSDFLSQSKRIFILNSEVKNQITQYLRRHSAKDVIKIIDITPMWTAGTVSKLYADGGVETFPKVFPYFALPDRISSYGGFTFYLSARADYMKIMPVEGEEITVNPDWGYIKSTGADFLVARATDVETRPLSSMLATARSEDILRLPTGAIIVPLVATKPRLPNDRTFNNGYFKVSTDNNEGATGLVNIALGKPARQSSNAGADARLAVDGNTNGNFSLGSVSHTLRDTNAWLEIDLGASEPINNVTVWNRTDCCGYCLRDYWLFISNKPFKATDTALDLSKRPGTWGQQNFIPNPYGTIATEGVVGRYVRIQLPGDARTLKECFLSVAEVEVYRSSPSGEVPSVQDSKRTSDLTVKEFTTNHASYMRLEFDTSSPSTVQYLFWNNPRLKFYLNGKLVVPKDQRGVPIIDVPPGRNTIEVRYRHWPLTVFWVFYALFASLIGWVLLPANFQAIIMNKFRKS